MQTALAVGRTLGLQPVLTEGSTDANLPISLKIPAITIGGGGSAANSHALSESFDATDAWKGAQNAVLLAIALAQELSVELQPLRFRLLDLVETGQVGRALAAGFAPRGQNPHDEESVGDAQDGPLHRNGSRSNRRDEVEHDAERGSSGQTADRSTGGVCLAGRTP